MESVWSKIDLTLGQELFQEKTGRGGVGMQILRDFPLAEANVLTGIMGVHQVFIPNNGRDAGFWEYAESIRVLADRVIDDYREYYNGLICDCCGVELGPLNRAMDSFGLCETCNRGREKCALTDEEI